MWLCGAQPHVLYLLLLKHAHSSSHFTLTVIPNLNSKTLDEKQCSREVFFPCNCTVKVQCWRKKCFEHVYLCMNPSVCGHEHWSDQCLISIFNDTAHGHIVTRCTSLSIWTSIHHQNMSKQGAITNRKDWLKTSKTVVISNQKVTFHSKAQRISALLESQRRPLQVPECQRTFHAQS